ncbi:hypothetical protein [Peptostreptococcus porci]|uniref:hypothetical protein n=1 Tax=Peptostreptococcus porci TaxID=2652282 RepID=UPI002A7EDF93|nr:hypothetical protein [Peptostreptococcus porci]MDY4129474.1 hypothetical protein [Peptostreptococcus porci]
MEDKITFNDKVRYQLRRLYEVMRSSVIEKKNIDRKFHYMRVRSIDVLRGILTILVIMIISQGLEDSVSKSFIISEWNGVTLAGVVLPFFILIMGASIPFYIKKYHENGSKLSSIIKKSLIRALLLLLLGLIFSVLFLESDKYVRVTGPFQLLAINYIISILAYMMFLKLRVKNNVITYVFAIIGLLIAMIFSVIFINGGREAATNIFVRTDMSLIGGYKSISLADPEGIMAIFSSISLGFLGISFGCILNKKHIEKKYVGYRRPMKIRNDGFSKENLLVDIKSWINYKSIKSLLSNYYRFNNEAKKVIHLLLFSLIYLMLFFVTKYWIPVNRNVFSISFVMIACFYFSMLLVVAYVVCDIVKLRFGANYLGNIGKNTILVIFTVQIVHKLLSMIKIKSIFTGTWLPFNSWFTTDFILPIFGIEFSSTVYSVFITVIWVLLFNLLDRYDIKVNL